MEKYIDYDYEALFDKALKDMEEANVERMLKCGRLKTVYATKEISAAQQLEVEIYPEFSKAGISKTKTPAQIAKQRRVQRNLNEKNSRKACERLIMANFDESDIWATLTYDNGHIPQSMKEAKRNMNNYIRRLNTYRKKQGLEKLRYIYVTECSDKGRWHHHIILDGDMGLDTVEQMWKLGGRNQTRRLHKDENGLSGMAKYITKDKGKHSKYQKAWSSSRGLKKPKIKKNHYKFRKKDVKDIVTGKSTVAKKAEYWYGEHGYEVKEHEIRYNEINGGYYIYVRMYRNKEGSG